MANDDRAPGGSALASAAGRDVVSSTVSTWLIVGHGTVGHTLSQRILDARGSVLILDDTPRIAPEEHERITVVGDDEQLNAAYVALCVPSPVVGAAAAHVRTHALGTPLVLDWASAPPSTKREVAGPDRGDWIDVALLDSLDRAVERPLLAVSGNRADEAATALRALEFEVAVAGDEVGLAAGVKVTRSLFMKPLEALVVEFRAVATLADPSGAAWRSIVNNLGPLFSDFADVLVTSDVTHAARRVPELHHALSYAAEHGCSPVTAEAAAVALGLLAEHWSSTSLDSGATVPDILGSARAVFSAGVQW